MKKVYIVILIIFLGSNYLFAQDDCTSLIIGGKTEYNKGNYKKALDYFEMAVKADKKCAGEAVSWIKKCAAQLGSSKPRPATVQPKVINTAILLQQLSFSPLGEEQQLEKQGALKIKSNVPWCKVTETGNLLKIECLPNDGEKDREGIITLVVNGKESSLTISQERIKVQLNPSYIEILPPSGEEVFIYVSSNVPWKPFSDASWCSVEQIGDIGFIVNCQKNTYGKREAHIGITTGDRVTSITVLQNTTSLLKTENWLGIIKKAVNNKTTKVYNTGKYKGGYSNNRRTGFGCCLWSDNTVYIGEWSVGKQQGQGIYIAPKGYSVRNCPDECQYYVGGWEQDEKSGTGNCYDDEGNLIYHGNFHYDEPGDKYPGENKNNFSKYKFQLIKYENDNIYLGETYDGYANGLGIFLYGNGDMWYGQWINGTRTDSGIEIKFDGNMITGK
ncbi:MAG: hypothetical protein LBR26_05490 [Prevotella sp.]|jgi:hypothetical protein|nr:hypothetical protein [Prevotella sp.]